MRDIYIVSDVHGDWVACRTALYNADIFDNHGQKDPNAYVVQIGDFINAVTESHDDDMECLKHAREWFDRIIVGNHEMPYFDSENYFSGFRFYADISQELWSLHAQGILVPAVAPDLMRVLITHAGITRSQLNLGTGTDAFSVYHKLIAEWQANNFKHYLFSDVGRARHGRSNVGGVLWCDFDREFEPCDFPQVVGHTPGILRQKDNSICIDTIRANNLPTVLKLEA